MQKPEVIKVGPGWTVLAEGDSAWIKFDSSPDHATLARLREVGDWDRVAQAWRAHPDFRTELVRIGELAQTWESVGEDPSWFTADDYPIFH